MKISKKSETAEAGSALTETIILMAAMIPLFIAIPMSGKLGDFR